MPKRNPLDSQDLRQVILDSPKQFAVGLEIAKDIKPAAGLKAIEVSGMGGSSLPVDILRTYVEMLRLKNPKKNQLFGIFQNRNYSLPAEAYAGCLNIFSSYSGNTEETLASLKEGMKAKLPMAGLAAGGKLAEACRKAKIPCASIPGGIQPRYATGYFFAAMARILSNAGLIEDVSEEIAKEAKKLEAFAAAAESRGKALARKLKGRTPIIHASERFKPLAMIWKIKINENAKTPAFYNFYPELNHNEMVGFTNPQGAFHIVALTDRNDHPQIRRRMEITAKLLKKKGIGTSFVEMPSGSPFYSIFATLLLGDWTSYYLALEYGQDPTPVDMVEDLKKMLA